MLKTLFPLVLEWRTRRKTQNRSLRVFSVLGVEMQPKNGVWVASTEMGWERADHNCVGETSAAQPFPSQPSQLLAIQTKYYRSASIALLQNPRTASSAIRNSHALLMSDNANILRWICALPDESSQPPFGRKRKRRSGPPSPPRTDSDGSNLRAAPQPPAPRTMNTPRRSSTAPSPAGPAPRWQQLATPTSRPPVPP